MGSALQSAFGSLQSLHYSHSPPILGQRQWFSGCVYWFQRRLHSSRGSLGSSRLSSRGSPRWGPRCSLFRPAWQSLHCSLCLAAFMQSYLQLSLQQFLLQRFSQLILADMLFRPLALQRYRCGYGFLAVRGAAFLCDGPAAATLQRRSCTVTSSGIWLYLKLGQRSCVYDTYVRDYVDYSMRTCTCTS